MTTQLGDASEAAFTGRMLEILNDGALAMMISLGHRAGLFDAMARLDFATSQEVADEAGLAERYVREWLGAMATGRVVEFHAERGTYRLPPQHAALLTRGARIRNLAAAAQWMPLLGSLEDRVLACLEQGGGVPAAAFERFYEVMSELSDRTVVDALHDGILPLVPGGGAALERGCEVLDVGCGCGRALNELAATYPRSRFTGYDLSADAIAIARSEARERGLANVAFEVRDAAELRAEAAFDLVTAFDTVHEMARPADVLAAVAAALRPAGAFLMQEVAGTGHVDRDSSLPLASLLYAISCLHCTTVSLAAGGAGLGAMWGEEAALRMLADAGFGAVAVASLPRDPIHRYFVARRGHSSLAGRSRSRTVGGDATPLRSIRAG